MEASGVRINVAICTAVEAQNLPLHLPQHSPSPSPLRHPPSGSRIKQLTSVIDKQLAALWASRKQKKNQRNKLKLGGSGEVKNKGSLRF